MSLVRPTSTSGRARQYRAIQSLNDRYIYSAGSFGKDGKMYDGLSHRYERFAITGIYSRPVHFSRPVDLRDTEMTRRWRRVPAHA